MTLPLTLAIVLAVVIPVQLWRAYRGDLAVAEWAHDHGVDLTDENRPMVERYLRRARVLRTWGGVAGAIVPSVLTYLFTGRVAVLGFGTDGTSAPLGFGTIFIGYLLGALCAEVWPPRPVAGSRRTASLAPRELEGYLPRRVIAAQRALTVAAGLGVVTIGLVPLPATMTRPGLVSTLLVSAVVLACGAGLEATERWLVRRPQPFTDPLLVAADDAIRAQSIHRVAAAGLALLLLCCCGVALGLQASDVPLLQVTMTGLAAICLVGAIAAWGAVGEHPWHVRRAGAASA